MKIIKYTILPVLLATIWISVSEFARNEFLLKSYWTEHYQAMGLVFPSDPLNGALWGVWALIYAIFVYALTRKFFLFEATLLAWVSGFVMMWLVIGNLGVLPLGLLYAAVPLSLLEAFVTAFIFRKLGPKGA